jgi:hypothetical protein
MSMSPAQFLVGLAIAIGLSLALFAHADRNGNKHATAWGIGAFLLAGVVVPLYVILTWSRRRKQRPG